ncbi:MAG: SAM-dependent methyltransferase [Tepidibacter sp.]|jgi:SAM-dependent methyltransferase|uniref:class I SAM-dependent methyltransferase n=1 Tax=Tepidibacter sp. TaxID=2529387 RepID=UPI0025E79DBB|nr:SAM-dependent methyltransferase [Tepidibacter sp.]MCT4509087.1 SAM-dependent methyltransferase [Tepidibacter sp.]
MNSNDLINDIINDKELIQAVLSNKRNKELDYNKINIRPIKIKNDFMYQLTYVYSNKEIHKNLLPKDTVDEIIEHINKNFKQAQMYCINNDYQILVNKKGKANVLKKKATKKTVNISHNRKKKYILEEDVPCDFLQYLGVMNEKGNVKKQKRDKFRQLNRFLEMVKDVEANFDKNKRIKIIDFGCGKSYLTFALYYYLVKIAKFNVEIVGLDIKKDVIEYCNKVAKELNYENLSFQIGNISDFDEFTEVDMVVTLHACDIATDMALFKAICWNSKVILSVPCCQHELNTQIKNDLLSPMLKHGIIKERLSSLATDSIRANLLEIIGYKTQILEFIETEHTPKNLLIRAVKYKGEIDKFLIDEYKQFKKFLNASPYLEKLLVENNIIK